MQAHSITSKLLVVIFSALAGSLPGAAEPAGSVHWAFVRPVRPALPEVKSPRWPRNGIDHFVLAKLDKIGLKPEAEADRPILIRRLSLDLIGLPQTPEAVEEFIRDSSPDAYEKLVDRLLASERFGEHWARMWLDLARYADTKGYEKDQARSMWRYRDWVIDAYNSDLPYDQFTREQLAGDLLPDATESQILATAFHRNTMTNDEGGTDDEEFRILAIKDRVDTTAQVWMGLTMGCAKCHSHKFDPITHAEYYQFFGLLNQTEDADRGDDAPTMPMPTPSQKQKRKSLESELARDRNEFWIKSPELTQRQTAWEQQMAAPSPWIPLRFESGHGIGGSVLQTNAESIITVTGAFPEAETNIVRLAPPPGRATAIRLELLSEEQNKGPGRNRSDRNVVISELEVAWEKPEGSRQAIKLKNARADFSQEGWNVRQAIDGDLEKGWAFSPQQDRSHVAVFDLDEPREFDGGQIVFTIIQRFPKLQMARFRLSSTHKDAATLRPEFNTTSEFAALAADKRTAEQQKALDETFRREHEPMASIYKRIVRSEKQLKETEAAIAKMPIMRELAPQKQRVTRIHRRGNFLDPGDVVVPGVPGLFGPLPPGAPTNRLGVAEWLVQPDNPLTARVAVNRAWARFFGTGLVETEEDLGTQGALPTHPELLDWLAVEFRDSLGWSWKKLCKTIVMSAAYRQSSRQDPGKLKIDPRNQWLSRAPRFRLSAETVRDQALAVAGLLSRKTHGPSVMPPQPEGIWRAVYSGLRWQTSPGEDRYRRALYTFCRRTSPYPAMTTFDAGSGEVCTVRRIRTNTPLQALVTLNDPAFFEAAAALGRRMNQGGGNAGHAVERGFQLVLARPPAPGESERLVRLFESSRTGFERDTAAAKELLDGANLNLLSGESAETMAAWAVVANVLLNLDETLTKP
jgi:hypothetical protein